MRRGLADDAEVCCHVDACAVRTARLVPMLVDVGLKCVPCARCQRSWGLGGPSDCHGGPVGRASALVFASCRGHPRVPRRRCASPDTFCLLLLASLFSFLFFFESTFRFCFPLACRRTSADMRADRPRRDGGRFTLHTLRCSAGGVFVWPAAETPRRTLPMGLRCMRARAPGGRS